MCEYVKENKCSVTSQICPYVYYCDKTHSYRASNYMPSDCKIKRNVKIPSGYYKVRQERKGYLYIDYDDVTIKVRNPFNYIPVYVKVKKTKDGKYNLKE
nr:MAG TPA: hypothetical protein [Caudoviricetes sp.]